MSKIYRLIIGKSLNAVKLDNLRIGPLDKLCIDLYSLIKIIS